MVNRTDIAKIIWHRFAKDNVEFWEDETHQAEYLDCAHEILCAMGLSLPQAQRHTDPSVKP